MWNLIKHYALLWLAGFQQLWLVHFDPHCSDGLFCQQPAFSQLSCCCVSWSWHPCFWNFNSTILLTLLGRSLMWITSLTLHVYQCRSRDHLGFTLRRRFVQATSPLPTTTRHTHCFQVWNYAKITPCTAKTPCDPIKQDCAVYKIPCDCGKVYISESGRPMKDRIKEHEWDIRFAHTQTSTVLEQHQQG